MTTTKIGLLLCVLGSYLYMHRDAPWETAVLMGLLLVSLNLFKDMLDATTNLEVLEILGRWLLIIGLLAAISLKSDVAVSTLSFIFIMAFCRAHVKEPDHTDLLLSIQRYMKLVANLLPRRDEQAAATTTSTANANPIGFRAEVATQQVDEHPSEGGDSPT